MNPSNLLILVTTFFFTVSGHTLAAQTSVDPVPLNQRLTEREQGDLLRAVAECWNSHIVQNATGPTTIRVVVNYDAEKRPTHIEPHQFQSTSEAISDDVFQAARRAIYRCSGARLSLPEDKYQGWQRTVVTFALDALTFETYADIAEAVPDVIASPAPASPSNVVQNQVDPDALLEARNECDRLASDPLDPNRRYDGTDWADMDHASARHWCRIAAFGDRSDLTSMANFARALAEVDGVQAGQLVLDLSKSGYPISHYYMGVFYATGENGFQQSSVASVESFESALELGIPRAANRLGLYFASVGNTNAALRYWRIGAQMGDEPSIANIPALQAERDGQQRLLSLFGNFPQSYPTYGTAVRLIRQYADTCTREGLSYCSNICGTMLGELNKEYGNASRDAFVPPYWDGCVRAILQDAR